MIFVTAKGVLFIEMSSFQGVLIIGICVTQYSNTVYVRDCYGPTTETFNIMISEVKPMRLIIQLLRLVWIF